MKTTLGRRDFFPYEVALSKTLTICSQNSVSINSFGLAESFQQMFEYFFFVVWVIRGTQTLFLIFAGLLLPQTSAWANSIITTFDRFVTPEPCLALAFHTLSLGVARCELRPAGDPQISRNTSTRTSAK